MNQNSLRVEKLVVGQLSTNCFIVSNRDEAIIIDPGDDGTHIIDNINNKKLKLKAIIATHGHFDHILGAFEIQGTYNAPFLIHSKDTFLVKRMRESVKQFLTINSVDPEPKITGAISDKEIYKVGEKIMKIIHTPGHTPGSCSLYFEDDNALFVGDVLFYGGGVGRTDFSYCSPSELESSISKIFSFNDNTIIYSGHGENSTVKQEKAYHNV